MIIHEVKDGETIYSIATKYGISAQRLVQINGIDNPEFLSVGMTLIILYSNKVHIVQKGDSLGDIARTYHTSVIELLKNNPYLSDRGYIYPGEELVISYDEDRTKSISVNGYAYPYIKTDILKKTLPYLTYLTISYYRVTSDGNIVDLNDAQIIKTATEYGVAPIMLLSSLNSKNAYNETIIHELLTNQIAQNSLIENTLSVLKAKGFYGLTMDFPHVRPSDGQHYMDLVVNMSNRLNNEGFIMNISLNPTTFEVQSGFIYRDVDYSRLGKVTDGTMLLSYDWGGTYAPPIALYSFDTITKLINYAVTQIPSYKISLGIPSIGYRRMLPYKSGDVAEVVSLQSAIEMAREFNVSIQYDTISEIAFYRYIDNDQEYIVEVKDARSLDARFRLVTSFDCAGVGIWNIMQPFTQIWMMLHSMFKIDKKLKPMV